MTVASALAIEAQALTKSYAGRRALDSFDLDAEPGTILALLGPNGAGKTTAIRVLTTVLEPDGGSFSVDGVPQTRPVDIRRRIGVLPESAGLPTGQTGEEVLVFQARLHGRTRHDARVEAQRLLADVGLADRARLLVSGYSRGMRQRLGIARALVSRPRVVFLDEPTLGLDPAGQRQALAIVSAMARERGATVVLSTHLLAEVEEICDRVLILNRGRVVADGSVADVARRAIAPRRGRVRVPRERAEVAYRILTESASISAVDAGDQAGELVIELAPGVTGEAGSSQVLRALLAEDVAVIAFDMEAGRLSDAYLELTAVR